MTSVPRALSGVVLAALVGAAAHGLFAQQPERVRVIIAFQQAPGAAEQAIVTAAGGTVRHTYWLVPAVAAEVPVTALTGLRNNPNVTAVDLDTEVYAIDAELDSAWGVKRIGAGVVHDAGNTGGTVRVCVVDSGVAMGHPDLAGSYLGGWDFVNDDSDPSDDNGHGTHVAGTILARDNNAGVVGVAPTAKLLAFKMLNQNGSGYFSDAILSLQACLQNGGQVANHSYGSSGDPGTTVRQAFDNADAMGLLNVAAAGNQTTGRTCSAVGFPARYASVVAVTATGSTDAIASFSCRGPEAELAAPGVSIVSTVPTGTCSLCASTGYRSLNGTSMASPHVAGVAALVIASGIADMNGNGRVNDEVRARLQTTADDLGTAGLDNLYGYGLVDADEAAASGGSAPTPPGAPASLFATTVSSSQIDLSWTDDSTDESGFRIERCAGAGCSDFAEIATVGAGVTAYASTNLAAATPYSFRVRAYNAGGNSDYSPAASAVTNAAPAGLSLTAVGNKVKGVKQADLTWSGSNATNIDVYRDGAKITTTPNDGAYTDAIGGKGGGSYTYMVCDAGGTSTCSNTAQVVF